MHKGLKKEQNRIQHRKQWKLGVRLLSVLLITDTILLVFLFMYCLSGCLTDLASWQQAALLAGQLTGELANTDSSTSETTNLPWLKSQAWRQKALSAHTCMGYLIYSIETSVLMCCAWQRKYKHNWVENFQGMLGIKACLFKPWVP